MNNEETKQKPADVSVRNKVMLDRLRELKKEAFDNNESGNELNRAYYTGLYEGLDMAWKELTYIICK